MINSSQFITSNNQFHTVLVNEVDVKSTIEDKLFQDIALNIWRALLKFR